MGGFFISGANMAFNGSGVFTLVSGNPVVTGTTISSTWANNTLSDIATGLSTTITKDGQTTPTANIPMGGFKFTGLGAGTATGNSLRFEQLFSQGTPVALASAATVDIGGQNSVAVEISGTTTITSFGTNYNGPRFLRFTGALVLTHNATTLNLPGGANITTAAGDTGIAYPNLSSNGWNVVVYQRQGTLNASAGINGGASNLRAILTSNGNSVTFTADGITVSTALDGAALRLPSFNKTLNTATTGAGGMDTGSAPTSGYVAIYAIAKADGTQSILGVNAATSTGSIYSGANMPSGYTYSALIAIWPTNATPNLLAGMVDENRQYFYQTAKLVTGPAVGPTSLTSVSLSSHVPVAAKAAMLLFAETSTSANAQFGVAADSTGIGVQVFHGATDSATRAQPSGIVSSSWNASAKTPLIAAQTAYWFAIGGGNEYLYCTGYSF